MPDKLNICGKCKIAEVNIVDIYNAENSSMENSNRENILFFSIISTTTIGKACLKLIVPFKTQKYYLLLLYTRTVCFSEVTPMNCMKSRKTQIGRLRVYTS